MKKKLLSLALVLALLPLVAKAEGMTESMTSDQYTFENGVLTIHDGVTEVKTLFGFEEPHTIDEQQITRVVIPNSVTSIDSGAFYGYKGLTNVTIPDSVTNINPNAFSKCTSLTSVTIPDSVTDIWYGAFSGCTGLTDVTISSHVTSILDETFSECTSLTSVTIPDGVTHIGDGAFYKCTSLTSVTIPASVTSIKMYAFGGCTSLTDVTYGGTEEQWAAIEVGQGNDPLTEASIHCNSATPSQPVQPDTAIAYPSIMEVDLDGEKVTFQGYALKEGAGLTNYIKLRDFADLMNGTTAQFEVGWDGTITITTQTPYTPNGSEGNTPFSGERAYEKTAVQTLVNGQEAQLDTFQLKDDNGGGYTYYKLRDLGTALGITVDWTAQRGIFIETK